MAHPLKNDGCKTPLATMLQLSPPQLPQPCRNRLATARNYAATIAFSGPQPLQLPPKGWRFGCAHRLAPRAYPRASGQTPSRLRLRVFRPTHPEARKNSPAAKNITPCVGPPSQAMLISAQPMQDDDMTEQLPAKAPKKERPLPRKISQAVEMLVNGEKKTITAAAQALGLTREHLSKSLRTPRAQVFIEQRTREILSASRMPAAATLLLIARICAVGTCQNRYCDPPFGRQQS
jgi:hypothetical protein